MSLLASITRQTACALAVALTFLFGATAVVCCQLIAGWVSTGIALEPTPTVDAHHPMSEVKSRDVGLRARSAIAKLSSIEAALTQPTTDCGHPAFTRLPTDHSRLPHANHLALAGQCATTPHHNNANAIKAPVAASHRTHHMPSTYDLKGRNAVVTGGAQGIGRATTERFLASGAKVAIWDFDLKLATKTAEALGKDVLAVACDVTDPKSVQAARDATLKAFGKIDILVNNAGIAGPTAKLWDYSLADLKQTMAVNLEGPFNCCQAVIPGMIKNNYGRIVNIASIAGKEGNPNASAYSASKAALIGLTKSLGKELAAYDISVNAVTPAAARTAIFDQITQEHIDFMLSKIPRARFVTVEEVAALITFAASSDCSFTTGQVLDISGGRATY
jgi:2-dehydro-3-deoxy-L-rhamnonate dehydrogenase (NAD+)